MASATIRQIVKFELKIIMNLANGFAIRSYMS